MLRPTAFGPFVILIAALIAIGSAPASAEELIIDGGFEAGLGDWTAIDGELSLVTNSHSGNQAVQLSGTGAFDAVMFEFVPVASLESYELSGWISAAPQSVERAHLRIHWINADGNPGATHDSAWKSGSGLSYEYLTTGLHVAPPGTVAARISLLAIGLTLPFSVLVDDISFDGPRPDPPTPTAPPTVPPTASPTAPPSSPLATATPQTPPTPTPTAAPTVSAPQTPTPIPAPLVPTAAPTPGPTPGAPVIFTQLTNGGFEDDGVNGVPLGWRKIGGLVESVSSPVRSGSRALALTSETTATKWAYQTVQVNGGEFYRASAFARYTDADVKAVFIRVSWYASANGSGQTLWSVDSETILTSASPTFQFLTTGAVAAPADARSARVRLMLRPMSGAQARAYFDDVAFTDAAPPTATPQPTATAPLPPGATAPDAATPTPTPSTEPQLFPALTNGSFEDVREDGTPYAWRKFGGEIAVTDTAHVDGHLALQFLSHTASTKWTYQVVTVEAGGTYEFAGFTAAGADVSGAFLQVSWYSSADGTGSMIASGESPSTSSATAAFQHLTTGAIKAPASAHSAKLRLMLRPASTATAVAYFDSLSFSQTTVALGDSVSSASPAPAAGREPGSIPPMVLGAVAAIPQIANVTPVPAPVATLAGTGDNALLFFLGSIAVPFVGLTVIGAIELSRRRETTDH